MIKKVKDNIIELSKSIKKKRFDLIKDTATENEHKLNILLDMIDYIKVNPDDNSLLIKTSKNLIIENNGNTINITNGVSVSMAKVIHLNPVINFEDKDMNSLEQKLIDAEIEESRKDELKAKSSECLNDDNCHL